WTRSRLRRSPFCRSFRLKPEIQANFLDLSAADLYVKQRAFQRCLQTKEILNENLTDSCLFSHVDGFTTSARVRRRSQADLAFFFRRLDGFFPVGGGGRLGCGGEQRRQGRRLRSGERRSQERHREEL